MNPSHILDLNLINEDLINFSCSTSSLIGQVGEIKNILLTGSTGFLGKYILDNLLIHTNAHIYCLVRTKDNKNIKERFAQSLIDAGLELDDQRITLVHGDLNKENMGLSSDVLKALEESIDSIYHCGAFVHHLNPYKILRQDVIATKFLIDFSTKHKQKQLHYVSTMNISNANQDIWKPATNLQDIYFCDMGYMQVKWVCEKIIYTYIDKQYPFYVYRPGNITGDSKTGYCFPWNNHALLLVKGFLQSAVVPKWTDPVEMTPVDFVAEAIVKLSLNTHKTQTRTFNLHNPSTLPWSEYIQKVADILKRKIVFVDQHYWKDEILTKVERNNPLFLFKDFYSVDGNKFNYQPPQDAITQKVLGQLGVCFPSNVDYEFLIKIYSEFLLKMKFFIKN